MELLFKEAEQENGDNDDNGGGKPAIFPLIILVPLWKIRVLFESLLLVTLVCICLTVYPEGFPYIDKPLVHIIIRGHFTLHLCTVIALSLAAIDASYGCYRFASDPSCPNRNKYHRMTAFFAPGIGLPCLAADFYASITGDVSVALIHISLCIPSLFVFSIGMRKCAYNMARWSNAVSLISIGLVCHCHSRILGVMGSVMIFCAYEFVAFTPGMRFGLQPFTWLLLVLSLGSVLLVLALNDLTFSDLRTTMYF
ncbi:unnamed protein product [Darwinula stevensoni]|uniref:Uncharacterized protein n=1 Tax=Darwinula stevensoni TaxID=69355 RepID=A0A7R8X420_9CRUS|nr:unnamed protein product [Darwinula stevensoni]CAG0884986.1 unnamed protein product [Darwinula stevensoni]